MNSLTNAFISYGRADSKVFATKLYQHLTEQGLKIWFDFEDIPLEDVWKVAKGSII